MKRRQEVRGKAGGVTVSTTSPTTRARSQKTLAAIRGAYPGARLLAAFEPRSNTSRRNLHQRDYAAPATWGDAAEVFLLRPAPTDRVPESERLDVDAVVARGVGGGDARARLPAVDELGARHRRRPRALVTSSSPCRTARSSGIWGRLLEALGAAEAAAVGNGKARPLARPGLLVKLRRSRRRPSAGGRPAHIAFCGCRPCRAR